MNKEERFEIELNQEDVQNLINCYEKDIEYIKNLEQENKELHNKIDKAIEYIEKFSDPSIGAIKEILKDSDVDA